MPRAFSRKGIMRHFVYAPYRNDTPLQYRGDTPAGFGVAEGAPCWVVDEQAGVKPY